MTDELAEQHWRSLPQGERQKIREENDLSALAQDAFYSSLATAEAEWTSYAILLIDSGVDQEVAIAITAEGCAVRHRELRARTIYETFDGHECEGTCRIVDSSEAALRAIQGLLAAARPSETLALASIWKSRFAQGVKRELEDRGS